MASVAVTPGILWQVVSAAHVATTGPGVSSAFDTSSCINLEDKRIAKLWGHQKKDFINCNSSKYSSCKNIDEVFAFHLLKIHAKFCIELEEEETLLKCRYYDASQMSEDDIFVTEQSPLELVIKQEPNFTDTGASSDNEVVLVPNPGLKTRQSLVKSGIEINHEEMSTSSNFSHAANNAHARGVTDTKGSVLVASEESKYDEMPSMKLEPPDQVTFSILAQEFKQNGVRGEDSGHQDCETVTRIVREETGEEFSQEGVTSRCSTSLLSGLIPGDLDEGQMGSLSAENDRVDGRPNKRSLCSKTFCSVIGDRTHKHQKSYVKLQPRQICVKESEQVDDSGMHIDTCTKERSFSCKLCQDAIDRKKYRQDMKTRDKKHLNCSICRKTFAHNSHLTRHMRIHTHEKPFSCSKCTKAFSKKSNLTRHMRTVHMDERPYSCSICSKAFFKQTTLTEHMTSHVGERKNYSDNICIKAFSSQCYLKTHKRKHTAELREMTADQISEDRFTGSGSSRIQKTKRNGERPFRCRVCSEGFSDQRNLKRHMLSEHMDLRPFSCSICRKVFCYQKNLENHMKRHTGHEEVNKNQALHESETGTYSSIVQSRKESLNSNEDHELRFISEHSGHLERETMTEKFRDVTDDPGEEHEGVQEGVMASSEIQTGFNADERTEDHKLYSIAENPGHGGGENVICEEEVTKRETLQEGVTGSSGSDELTEDHNLQSIVENPRHGENECVIGKRIELSEREAFLQDEIISAGIQSKVNTDFYKDQEESKFEKTGIEGVNCCRCCLCSKTFANEIELRKHEQEQSCVQQKNSRVCSNDVRGDDLHDVKHSDERAFSCKFCEKGFQRNQSLVMHMRTHNRDNSTTCCLCRKTFPNPSHLRRHMRTHTGEKPFSCSFCTRAFSDKSNLRRHINEHTRKETFVCSVCHKVFSRKFNMRQHMKSHTFDKPFACTICKKVFAYQRNLKLHMKRHSEGGDDQKSDS